MTSTTPVVSTVIKDYNYTQNAFLPKVVTIPLTEEYNVTYKSLVKAGDVVKEGDVIAESVDSLTPTYIHSSVPGTVEAIEPCYAPNTKQGYGITIKFGGPLSFLGKKIKPENTDYLTPLLIENKLIEKGVMNTFNITCPVNLGVQISKNRKAKCLIVRMFDEDPYRYTDSLVTKFYYKEIITAAELVAKTIDADGVVFVVDQKSDYEPLFKDVHIPNFRVLEMNIKRYPSGTPREIASAFRRTGLKKTSNFNITKSDLFVDSSTLYQVYKAVVLNTPEISVPVHFTGNCLYASAMLDVKVGTPISSIVKQIGGFLKTPEIVIVNGDLCGCSIQSLDAPITKYVKSIKFISTRKFTDNQIYACVNCGNCRSVCPVKISPDVLYTTTVSFQPVSESFAKSSLACISCGLCNTVCPARLPLSQTISVLKENVTGILKESK